MALPPSTTTSAPPPLAQWGRNIPVVAAAIESGAGGPFHALLNDGDLYATTAEYLDYRARETEKRMKRKRG